MLRFVQKTLILQVFNRDCIIILKIKKTRIMKYLLSVTLLFITILGSVAQTEKSAAELKNEGNTALKAKNYKNALSLFEAAISTWDEAEEMDAAMVYNTATCARKLKDNEKSLKYYQQAKELGYKQDISTYYLALAYKGMGKMEDMEKTLLAGITEFSTSKYLSYMKKELSKYYVIKGNEFFTKGIELLNSRTEGNRDQWDAIKEEAKVEFDKAAEQANKALEYNAKNSSAQTILSKIAELLKS
jgi:tetratricopeptide (TPR) repeat protein